MSKSFTLKMLTVACCCLLFLISIHQTTVAQAVPSADTPCLASGTYGFVLSGQITDGGVGPVGPAQVVGTWTFNSITNTMQGIDTVSYGGNGNNTGLVQPRTYDGIFTSGINPLGACTGTITLTGLGNPAQPVTASSAPALNFVVVNRGREILVMQTNPLRQTWGSAKRLR